MNNKRRDLLRQALHNLEVAETQINTALDEEQDCLSNLPENLEGSDRYESMENVVDNLEDALSSLEDVKENVESAISE